MQHAEFGQVDMSMKPSISEKLRAYIQAVQFFEDNIEDYVYIYNLTTDRVYLTGKIREKFPLPYMKTGGNLFSDWVNLVYHKDRELMLYYRNRLVTREIESFNIDYRLIDKKGNKVWVNVRGTLRMSDEYSLLVGRISEIVSKRRVDGLTGLSTAKKLMEDLKHCLCVVGGYLMILGIDNLKKINLTNGRAYGDDVLKKVTDVLEEDTNYPAMLYRLDGDCFAVNFAHKEEHDVVAFYSSIQEKLKHICTVSAGIVSYSVGDVADAETIYQYAENALDQAKREGKNRMIFFSPDSYREDLKQVELLNEMRASVEDDCRDFYLCYQPQINAKGYEIYGAEVLLRYHSPSRGPVSPVEFIPLLEDSKLICAVGKWVLQTAIAQCKEWRNDIPDFHVSVNISYVQLQQDGITDMVLDLLKEADIPGEALTLEITESMQLHDFHYFNKIFCEWKSYGIKISIDDFGTGYSSLSYLKSIEIDEVKIDKSFVDHIQDNAYHYRLLSNIIELAHSAKIKVCCEGIETVEELVAVQDLSADTLQGYLFAKPFTKELFEQSYIHADSEAYQERKKKELNFQQVGASVNRELLQELRKEEIGNIVDVMEELVYVSDVDTYELYYLNRTGRRISGFYDYQGCKCYQVLQGRDKPCEFCTNHKLSEDKFYVWERENVFLNRRYILKDKLIPWQGRIARFEMAIDITENEVVSEAIQKKLEVEKAISKISQIFSTETDIKKAIYYVLEMIGEFCQGDRACVLKRKQDHDSWALVCEWHQKEMAPLYERCPEQPEALAESDGPYIAVPIIKNGEEIGMIFVDHPYFKEEGRELVQTIAGILGVQLLA